MALTSDVKEELSHLEITKVNAKKAEVAALLRFSSAIHLVGGKVSIEAELDHAASARRLKSFILELYGHQSEVTVLAASGIRRSTRYILRVLSDGRTFAKQTGLLDPRGIPVRGLPSFIVGGSEDDIAAAWRGAFLAHGSVTEPGRSSALELTCSGPELALAMVGAARRIGVNAKSKEVRGSDRVVIRDGEDIGRLLSKMGAPATAKVWAKRRQMREDKANANRMANFDDANLRRSARAAVAAGARVERALEILGSEAPLHLREAGELRLKHRQSSLEELGQFATPPMTKDAIAGRIRRLLALADKTAVARGIPTTDANLSPELLEKE